MPAGGCATATSAAPGAEQFVERLSYFMTLVGLTALIIGGAGIANAVSAFVNRRTDTIATLKCLGAPSRTVFGIYLTEILLVAVLAIAIGLVAGALVPAVRRRRLLRDHPSAAVSDRIESVPLADSPRLRPPRHARLHLWPLARTRHVPASALFRHRIAHVHGLARRSST